MREVDTSVLVKKGTQRINWEKSVGLLVPFIYDDIEGEIKILEYKYKNYILVKFKGKEKMIKTSHFKDAAIGEVVMATNGDFWYNKGDVFTNKFSSIVIMNQIKDKIKKYTYKCLTCGNIDTVHESNLKKGCGCNVCSGKKALKGFNDIWTTNPALGRLLYIKDDGYIHTQYSSKKCLFQCPQCGYVKNMAVNNANQQGICCPICSDGISFPEKFMVNTLCALDVTFKKEYSILNKRYDFYIEDKNMIIEVHGSQHYGSVGFSNIKGARTHKEEVENDEYKKNLAISNGIENYIVINASDTSAVYLKNEIENSRLKSFYNLDILNWDDIIYLSSKSYMKLSWEMYDSGYKIIHIAQKIGVSRSTIRRYLKVGRDCGKCTYI